MKAKEITDFDNYNIIRADRYEFVSEFPLSLFFDTNNLLRERRIAEKKGDNYFRYKKRSGQTYRYIVVYFFTIEKIYYGGESYNQDFIPADSPLIEILRKNNETILD